MCVGRVFCFCRKKALITAHIKNPQNGNLLHWPSLEYINMQLFSFYKFNCWKQDVSYFTIKVLSHCTCTLKIAVSMSSFHQWMWLQPFSVRLHIHHSTQWRKCSAARTRRKLVCRRTLNVIGTLHSPYTSSSWLINLFFLKQITQ